MTLPKCYMEYDIFFFLRSSSITYYKLINHIFPIDKIEYDIIYRNIKSAEI